MLLKARISQIRSTPGASEGAHLNPDKPAVATVFEKIKPGDLPLNVFESPTPDFAGDADNFQSAGDVLLNDGRKEAQIQWASYPVFAAVENGLPAGRHNPHLATTTSRRRPRPATGNLAQARGRAEVDFDGLPDLARPADGGPRLGRDFPADRHFLTPHDAPYPIQLVPLAAIKITLGQGADLIIVSECLVRWLRCSVLDDIYRSASETPFARDIEAVSAWANPAPRTIQDASCTRSRVRSLRARNAAAHKDPPSSYSPEVPALDGGLGPRQASTSSTCSPRNGVTKSASTRAPRNIVNNATISARTSRAIGGTAPSSHLSDIEAPAQIAGCNRLDELVATQLSPAEFLHTDNFDAYFRFRRQAMCQVVESPISKAVQRDAAQCFAKEDSAQFEPDDLNDDMSLGDY